MELLICGYPCVPAWPPYDQLVVRNGSLIGELGLGFWGWGWGVVLGLGGGVGERERERWCQMFRDRLKVTQNSSHSTSFICSVIWHQQACRRLLVPLEVMTIGNYSAKDSYMHTFMPTLHQFVIKTSPVMDFFLSVIIFSSPLVPIFPIFSFFQSSTSAKTSLTAMNLKSLYKG